MLKKYIPILLLFCVFGQITQAQAPKRMSSDDIFSAIQKSQFLGSALYVAAHPDDENTSVISYLANDVKAETAYLSLTRGDGGQNLIGNELGELLGVLRTQELLAARRIDGGNQFFSRANDFGFSKHPDETLAIWDREKVTSDLVWVVRNWKPDIIINRFDHDSAGKTHGHHTSSAVLSFDTFEKYNDPTAFPEQLKYVDTWKPSRLFFNTSWWFYGSKEKFAEADKANLSAIDIGTYYPEKGLSNGEIAAMSRSQHVCQGMGRTWTRGSDTEYFDFLKGEKPKTNDDLFAGINTTWSRVNGGAPVGEILAKVEANFDHKNPSASIPQLVQAHKWAKALPAGHWRDVKVKELNNIIVACLGLYVEATADDYSKTPGQSLEMTMEVILRNAGDVVLEKVKYLPFQSDSTLNMKLEYNTSNKFYKTEVIAASADYTGPYWLNEAHEYGTYTVENQKMRGKPETPRALQVEWLFKVNGEPLTITTDVSYKKTDPEKGEFYRPFEIVPPVVASISEDVYVFANQQPQTVNIVVRANEDNVKGEVGLARPKGWKISPEMAICDLKRKGEEAIISFKIYPPEGQSEGKISPMVKLGNDVYTREMSIIEYDHIPTQTVLRNAESKVVKVNLEKKGERIGYIMGAGDKVPESLEAIGYKIDLLEDKDINVANLKQYDAIITGIRAYNVNERIKFQQPKLLEYVEQGGTLIIQYNTRHRLKLPGEELAPFNMKLSRDRVSDENAKVRFLAPDHPVLNTPNKITEKDFEGWVQERGLYFPDEWDTEKFTAILSANDKGEDARDGGLLVAKHGKGYYVYSGYSWFRELPAGVPGAYRLFANLISIGK